MGRMETDMRKIRAGRCLTQLGPNLALHAPGRQGMEPHVTIVWFVLPQWFQELGAFAKEENIPIAVEWAQTAFKLFGAPACSSPAGRACCAWGLPALGTPRGEDGSE